MGSLQYIIGYVVHKLYSKFKFSKIKILLILNSVYQKCCTAKLILMILRQ